MAMNIYKSGQGYYTRLLSGLGAGILVVAAAMWLRAKLYAAPLYVQWGVAVGVIVAFGLLIYHFVAKRQKSCDFMIATEAEMKKVNWPQKREVIGSTWVVIIATFLLALLLFDADQLFREIFQLAGVMKGDPLLQTLFGGIGKGLAFAGGLLVILVISILIRGILAAKLSKPMLDVDTDGKYTRRLQTGVTSFQFLLALHIMFVGGSAAAGGESAKASTALLIAAGISLALSITIGAGILGMALGGNRKKTLPMEIVMTIPTVALIAAWFFLGWMPTLDLSTAG